MLTCCAIGNINDIGNIGNIGSGISVFQCSVKVSVSSAVTCDVRCPMLSFIPCNDARQPVCCVSTPFSAIHSPYFLFVMLPSVPEQAARGVALTSKYRFK